MSETMNIICAVALLAGTMLAMAVLVCGGKRGSR